MLIAPSSVVMEGGLSKAKIYTQNADIVTFSDKKKIFVVFEKRDDTQTFRARISQDASVPFWLHPTDWLSTSLQFLSAVVEDWATSAPRKPEWNHKHSSGETTTSAERVQHRRPMESNFLVWTLRPFIHYFVTFSRRQHVTGDLHHFHNCFQINICWMSLVPFFFLWFKHILTKIQSIWKFCISN